MVPTPVWIAAAIFFALVLAYGLALARAAGNADRALARQGPRCPECDAPPGAECEAWCSSWSTRP
jgi:hypothetical protein